MPTTLCAGNSLPIGTPAIQIISTGDAAQPHEGHVKLSRFAALNRSFNSATNIASSLRSNGHRSAASSRPVSPLEGAGHLLASPTSSDFVRRLSLRLKEQVQTTLSEPVQQADAVKGCNRKCGRCGLCTRKNSSKSTSALAKKDSVKDRMAKLTNRLNISKLLNDSQQDDEEQYATSTDDESEDPEYLELREREQIVERYEMGPESKDVDPWENPDFELYHITDRFGFVHKNKPPKTKEEQEKARVERELKRVKKWLHMLEEWKHRHPAKLPQRIWKGVPEKLRMIVWQRLLNVADMKSNARDNMYRELLMRARLISKDIKQIDLDINRTYRDHLAFRRRYDVKQQSLFNVLSAYALFNTEVGYCQGMSQIAAIFLMYMDEEDAFWCLHSLMVNRKYTMHGFFVPGFPKLKRFQDHYEAVLKKYVPGVKKHLDKVDIPPIYVTKWWFGCFLDRVPFPLALRLWDVFLYYGDCILIAMSYNIMKMHQKMVKKLNMETFMEFIQSRIADDFGYSDDKVMESLEECLRKLQNDRMALPPPPGPGDPAEVPTKPMGEALTRSMIDIRMSIAELHSRASRANSPIKFIDEDDEQDKKEGA